MLWRAGAHGVDGHGPGLALAEARRGWDESAHPASQQQEI